MTHRHTRAPNCGTWPTGCVMLMKTQWDNTVMMIMIIVLPALITLKMITVSIMILMIMIVLPTFPSTTASPWPRRRKPSSPPQARCSADA